MRIAQVAPLSRRRCRPSSTGALTCRSLAHRELVRSVTTYAFRQRRFARGELRYGRARCGLTVGAGSERVAHDDAGAGRQRVQEFDVLHFHLDYYPFSLFSRQAHRS